MCNMDLNVILKTTTGRKEEGKKEVLNPVIRVVSEYLYSEKSRCEHSQYKNSGESKSNTSKFNVTEKYENRICTNSCKKSRVTDLGT